MSDERDLLDALPRLGWVTAPTPVESLAAVAGERGLGYLGVKRDDLLGALHGGSKPRKLDYLLASPALANAAEWHSVGAIGSGHLLTLCAAADKLGRRVHAHCFWQDPGPEVLANLAYVASRARTLRYYRSRTAFGLRHAMALVRGQLANAPFIPPGATAVEGLAGLVHAALELARQVRAGELPEPERIYVALGTGGTVAGLAVGLGLSGLRCQVHAVAVVEHVFSPRRRVTRLVAELTAYLRANGVPLDERSAPARIVIDRSQLGRRYGDATGASLEACARLAREGVHLEPVYTGKAMAALLSDAKQGQMQSALLWNTAHGPLPPPASDWQARLPAALRRRLHADARGSLTRRAVLAGGVAATVGTLVGLRVTGYPDLSAWRGVVLSAWEAHVLRAVAEALLPSAHPQGLDAVPAAVDRFLETMPTALQREIHALIAFVEHGTLLGLELRRFTSLEPSARLELLQSLGRRGALMAQAQRGIRDLCLLGYYQQPQTWSELGYEGPGVGAAPRPWPSYDILRAAPGVLPKGAVS